MGMIFLFFTTAALNLRVILVMILIMSHIAISCHKTIMIVTNPRQRKEAREVFRMHNK